MRRVPLYPLVDYWGQSGPLDWSAVFGRSVPLVVEIGFGRGEHLVRWAQALPDRNVVGIETAWASIQRALRRIDRAGVTNVRIVYANAEWALYYLWPRASVERIVSLFPDPWPKARHVHHRLFSRRFFLRVHRVLQEGGTLFLATDDPAFVEWSLTECPTPGFQVHVETYRGRLRFGTKYEMKWYQ
ncbi:MAG: tRNA (guanosine(46)-N7)-methyltransferase TrmB, partial [Acidobacteria bacterium]|nr:tRNA (guanosine(46)-N7)-methyltransferase TrmB [Acidobacteriota bacterium]